jgi:hypothetical protein
MRVALRSRLAWAPLVLVGAGVCACRRQVATSDHAAPLDAATPASSLASPAPTDQAKSVGLVCTPDPSFAPVLIVPEASGAVEVALRPGPHELLVISDSENNGAALAYTLPSGPARALTLPLDPNVSDDIEGVAWAHGHVYALASTGYVERFTPDRKGNLARDGLAYGLGGAPYTTNAKFLTGSPPDFEGLCLRAPTAAHASTRCAGYAASRAYGWLVCLQWNGDRLGVDPDRPRLALDVKKHSLSDCAFGDEGGPAKDVLLVATNIFGGSVVYRVDEDTGALTAIDAEGTANDEAVAIDHDGRLYQLMDANTATSPATRSTCSGW